MSSEALLKQLSQLPPEVLSRLRAENLRRLTEETRQRDARDSMMAYIEYMQLPFKPAQHHRMLIAHLEAVQTGEIDRLMVCMPPGSAKSTYGSAIFPAWYLGKSPISNIIGCSHTQELADSFGRRVRNLFASEEHRAAFGVGVAEDSKAAGRWETEKGGEYFAAGVCGSIAGRRADLGIIDDPVRSREDADSPSSRQKAWEWYLNDFLPRLKPNAAQVVVMTRWHEDDLGGRILNRERERWRLLEIPMEATPGDPLGRAVGERLWPEWYTEEQVDTAKRDVRGWNALYQQQPATEEGDYFKAGWFEEYDVVPDEVHRYGASDYAVTEGGGDYTEHGTFAVDAWGNVYVEDWWYDQAPADVWIEKQCDMIVRHEPLCWFGEAGPIRRSVEPFLTRRMSERRSFCRLEWLPSIHDKPTRCRPFQAIASMGKVLMPRHAPWKARLIGQLVRFPAAKFDDAVDVCSLLGRGIEHVKLPTIRKTQGEPRRAMMSSGDQRLGWMGA